MAFKLVILAIALTCFTEDWSHLCEAQNTTDRIKPGETLRYSDRMLVSEDGRFQLGFFNVSYSSKKFMGIRYSTNKNTIRPWVWVANREAPVYNTSNTALTMDKNGLLQIITSGDNNKSSIFQLNPNRTSPESITILENSGNLVVKKLNPDGKILWESFDHPTDTLLPGMKLGGSNGPFLISWLSDSNPGPGPFTLEYDPIIKLGNEPLPFMVKRRGNLFQKYRPDLVEDWAEAQPSFVNNGTQSYFSYTSRNGSELILKLNPLGSISYGESVNPSRRVSPCSGAFSFDYRCADVAECRAGEDDFVERIAGPLFSNSSVSARYSVDDPRIVLTDCLDRCWRNCSCIGFNTLNLDDTGCVFWTEGAQFDHDARLGEQIYLLNSTYNSKKSGSVDEGFKWGIWVMAFAVNIWLF